MTTEMDLERIAQGFTAEEVGLEMCQHCELEEDELFQVGEMRVCVACVEMVEANQQIHEEIGELPDTDEDDGFEEMNPAVNDLFPEGVPPAVQELVDNPPPKPVKLLSKPPQRIKLKARHAIGTFGNALCGAKSDDVFEDDITCGNCRRIEGNVGKVKGRLHIKTEAGTALCGGNGSTFADEEGNANCANCVRVLNKAPVEDKPKKAPVTPKVGKACYCGCGEMASPKANFRPGHDSRVKGELGRLDQGHPGYVSPELLTRCREDANFQVAGYSAERILMLAI